MILTCSKKRNTLCYIKREVFVNDGFRVDMPITSSMSKHWLQNKLREFVKESVEGRFA